MRGKRVNERGGERVGYEGRYERVGMRGGERG